jgi:hypothetical protein
VWVINLGVYWWAAAAAGQASDQEAALLSEAAATAAADEGDGGGHGGADISSSAAAAAALVVPGEPWMMPWSLLQAAGFALLVIGADSAVQCNGRTRHWEDKALGSSCCAPVPLSLAHAHAWHCSFSLHSTLCPSLCCTDTLMHHPTQLH